MNQISFLIEQYKNADFIQDHLFETVLQVNSFTRLALDLPIIQRITPQHKFAIGYLGPSAFHVTEYLKTVLLNFAYLDLYLRNT